MAQERLLDKELRIYQTKGESVIVTNKSNRIIYIENPNESFPPCSVSHGYFLSERTSDNKLGEISRKYYPVGTDVWPKPSQKLEHAEIIPPTKTEIKSRETVDADDFYAAIYELGKSENKGKTLLDIIDFV
jgi:hypothetical protein